MTGIFPSGAAPVNFAETENEVEEADVSSFWISPVGARLVIFL